MVHDVSNAIVYLSGRHLLSAPSPCSRITGDHCIWGSESRYDNLVVVRSGYLKVQCLKETRTPATFRGCFLLLLLSYSLI